MPHPFFDVGRYPWSRTEAIELHKALFQAIKAANDIEAICQECSVQLDPLMHQAPRPMWKEALDAIAQAHLLRVLGERLLARQGLVTIHQAFKAAANLQDPVLAPVMTGGIFIDREPLRTKVNQMGDSAAVISVLLVRGDAKSGKTWTKHVVEDLAEAVGDKSVYLASGMVATAEEALGKVFAVLNGKVPKKLTTPAAWFRQACTEMTRLAARRDKERYWIIADDLNSLDPQIREFFDQAALEMQSRAFKKWFRLVLIDYPREQTTPTKWKEFWIEDQPKELDIDDKTISNFLMSWAASKKKQLPESKADSFAVSVLNKIAAPAPSDQRPRLERIHDEIKELLTTL